MDGHRKEDPRNADPGDTARFRHGDPVCWDLTGAGMIPDRAGHQQDSEPATTTHTWMEGTIREVGASTATVAFTDADGRTGVAIVPLDRIHARTPGYPCPDHPAHVRHAGRMLQE